MKKIVFILMFAFIFSCGKSFRSSVLKSRFELSKISCVVVLPFDSFPSKDGEEPGKIIASMMANKLRSTDKFKILEWNELDSILKTQNITLPGTIDSEFASNLGSVLAIDGVIYGAVTEYYYKKGKQGQQAIPVVGVVANMVSVAKKEIVWTASIARSSYDFFDTERDPISRVAMVIVDELVDSFAGKIDKRTIKHDSICWNPLIAEDMDGDGILNFADFCPLEPESFEGIMDMDGCPEPEIVAGDFRQLVELKGNRIVYKGNIPYAEKEATLLPEAAPILKGVAALIKDHPEITRITIEGFSEDAGSQKYQEEFSFNRAMSVKYFLMREGIPSEKLSAVGYEKIKNWRRSLVKEIEFSITR